MLKHPTTVLDQVEKQIVYASLPLLFEIYHQNDFLNSTI